MLDSNLSWYLLTAVWLLVGAIAFLPAVMSPMLFDAPGSSSNPFTVGFAASIIAFPFVCLAGAVLPWVLQHWSFAKWLLLLPLIHIGVLVFFGYAIGQSGGLQGRRSR